MVVLVWETRGQRGVAKHSVRHQNIGHGWEWKKIRIVYQELVNGRYLEVDKINDSTSDAVDED